MTTKSGKHANKIVENALSSAAKNGAAKAVDMRKVAALSAGAAGVIAGAAIAFGATPAMAAEAPTSTPVNPSAPASTQDLTTNKKKAEAEDSKKTATDTTKKEEAKKEQPEQTKPAEQAVAKTDGNTDVTKTEAGSKVESIASVDNQDAKQDSEETGTPAGSVVNKRTKRSLGSSQPEPTKDAKAENQNRDASGTTNQNPNKIKPVAQSDGSTKIEINENNAETMPNAYAWGSSDNTYSVDGEKHTVTFHFAAPKDGSKITNIAIFPSTTNGFNNEKSERGIDFYSKDKNKHQAYSGEYEFNANGDGSADLKMKTLFRDGNLNGGAEKYTASRSIFVYVTKDGKEDIAYKTNVFRTVTLVPPKTSGSVVLKYNQELTPEKVQAAITEAGNVETARSDKKSVNDQLSGKFTENIKVSSADAYDKTTFDAINAKKAGDTDSYVAGAKTLNTYMVTDLGFKSGAIPLTVARYDTRIDKPIVEDPTNVSAEVKEDIKKKLARLNNVSLDQVTINDQGEFTINFAGVDAKDAPKIALRDLVLKQLKDGEYKVPSDAENSTVKAVIVANPLGYSNAELKQIKKAIFEANKENKDLGLSATDYENQISLEYLKGNLTATGSANTGISNGQAENKITVKIKTDKAVAEFKSDIKANKLTRLPNIRTDYDVTWTSNKIKDRDTDEGLSWSEDHKTIIYRYDPTKAEEFDTNKILDLLKATPKNGASGLRDLTGNETLDHEGVDGKAKKSHVGYVLKDDQPTNELTLGNMSGGYWQYKQNVDNSGVNLGDSESNAGSYSWDEEAKPVVVAAKGNKVYKARLFVLPYTMAHYQHVYLEQGRNPGNTAKAINVIFVPQTKNKKSDLSKSIGEHKTITVEGKDVPTESTYYNASDKKKDAYDEALKEAKKALELAGNTEDSKLSENLKALIDNATINLNKARAELDGDATNKKELNKSIDENGTAAQGATAATPGTVTTDKYKNVAEPSFLKDDGTPDTDKNAKAAAAKKAYDEALQAAKDAKANDNATQKDVDAAKAKLDAARAKLNDFTTNKDKLNAAIAEHGKAKYVEDAQGAQTLAPAYQNATDDERKAYDDAVKKANELSADPNASQKEVNEAITALEAAKKALDAKATDKSQLIAAEKLSFDNPDPTNAAGNQSTFYKNAKAKAESTDSSVTAEQKEAAKKAYENYDTALDNARKVIADKNATQAQVDDAKKKLEAAEKALHDGYATDPDELTKVLADNFSGYLMPAYFNAFDKAQAGDADAKKAFKDYNDAYQKAKELKTKLEEAKNGGAAPEQTQINEAKTALEKARTVIDKYATNTSRLSAAVFNDLAIQNSPAYANVKELADKQNPSEEEKAQVEAAKKAKEAYEAAVAKLNQALNKQMPRDKQGNTEIPTSNTPAKDGNLDDKDYLNNIQAHAQGEPLDRDVDTILKEMNAAAAELNKFATKTDELLKSVNEDDATKQTPAFKNASQYKYQKPDGTGEDTQKNNAAKKAVDDYGAALDKAKELLKKPDATQKEVNDALKKLDDARTALDAYNTDTTKLDESVKKHGSTEGPAATEGTQTSDAYRNASDPHFMKADATDPTKLVEDTERNNAAKEAKKAYDEALTKAQELLKKHDDNATPQDAKPTQKDINKALKALDDARTEIEKYKTVTTDLEAEANKSTAEHAAVTEPDFESTPEFKNAQAKTSNGAENADVTAYKEALKKARDLAKAAHPTDPAATNSSHPTQKQINDALDALKQAKKQIEDNYKTDTSKLEEAKKYAEDVFKKTPEYKNALAKKEAGDQTAISHLGKDGEQTGFDNVLKKVADDLKDNDWKGKVTQKFVDKLLEKLQEAQDNITKNYKTDVTPLSNEVGDKDAQGKDVTPKFEESIPYKNALEKKNAGDSDATAKLKDYNDKLAAAQELINKVNNPDSNAEADSKPTQAQVDAALKALQDAKKAIDDSFGTKIDDLKTEAAKSTADGVTTVGKDDFEATTEFKNADSKKTDDGKDNADITAYRDALKKARALLEKFGDDGKPKPDAKDVPTQKEVDEALKNLKEIKDKITKNYVTSPHDLQQEVDKSKDGDTDTSTDVFENTPAFKNATAKGDDAAKKALEDYNKKLQDAKALLDKFDRTTGKPKTLKPGETAPTQKELDDALDALQAAKKKITDGYKTNKSDLNTEAGKDSDFTKTPEYVNAQAKGDDASKQALEYYKKALEDANKVLGDENATQADVDAALKKLQDAKSKLSDGYKTDKTNLNEETGNDTKFRKSIPFLIGKAADLAEYQQALNEANNVLNDPNATQAQVDEALRKLQAIKQKMIDFYNSLGSGSDDDSDGGSTGANNANANAANAVDKSMLHAEVNGALADIANGAGTKVTNGVNASVVKELNDALENAPRVLSDPNATREQVEAATMRLRAARAALNAAKANKGSNLRGNMGVQTGVDSATLSAFAAVFVGLAGLGVSAKRRKHASK